MSSYFKRPPGHYRLENLDPLVGTATIHGLEGRPHVLFTQSARRKPSHPPEISYHQRCTSACVPSWAIENDQISMLQAWLTNDGAKVERPILLDLLKTSVLRDKKAMAQLILKVDIRPPLDVSIVLRDCIREMRRPQIVTALTLGAKVNKINPEDMIYVFCAENGDIAKLFLDKGLDLDVYATVNYGCEQASLLWAACTRSDTDLLEALIKAGADTRLLVSRTDIPRPSLLGGESYAPYDKTPISAATLLAPNLSCLEFLLHNKYVQPGVDGVNRWLLSDLLLPNGSISASPWFVRREMNKFTRGSLSTHVDLVSDEPQCESRKPNTPLNCLEMLLNHGLDPNSHCASGYTTDLPMLMVAARNGNIEAMQLLLGKRALIEIGYLGVNTALMHALQWTRVTPNSDNYNHQLEVAMYLVRAGADVAPGNETAATAINMVTFLESVDVLDRLFEAMLEGHPPKYNHMDAPQYIKSIINRGYLATATALIQAVECGKPDLVRSLLDHGADVHQSDQLDRTAMNMANRQLRRHAGPRPETEQAHRARSDAEDVCAQLLLHGASPDKGNDADQNADNYVGVEEPRSAPLVEEAKLQREAAGDDGTAADGASSISRRRGRHAGGC